MRLQPGQRVGNYEVVRELAVGGQGLVCEARHALTREVVALKLLLDPEPATRARFLREARTLAKLDHPGLPRVRELGALPSGAPFLAMDLVRGRDLKAWVDREGPPPRARVVEVLTELAAVLEHCHARGVIHRDVKPHNVLLDEERGGRVVLVDFGLVLRKKHQLAWTTQDEASLTEDGSVVGTPAYMAPEQVSEEYGQVDRQTDVYALGGVLFFLLTGAAPFIGSGWGLLMQVMREAPRDPRALAPGVPAALAELCLGCLAKDPGARPRSAEVFAQELQRAEELEAQAAARRRRARGVGALGLVGLAVALAVSIGGGAPPAETADASGAPAPARPTPTPALSGLPRLRQDAASGDVAAMSSLGVALLSGEGAPKDLRAGERWVRRAAGEGDVAAQSALGLYLQGTWGGPKRPQESARWFRRAAESGHVPAMVHLGTCLATGQGVARDPQQAARWFRRAVEAGDAAGMFALAVSYARGLGVRADEREALRLFRRSAAKGHAPAMVGLANFHQLGLGGLRADPAEALRWFKRAAAKDDPQALMEVGNAYLHGRGVPRDDVEAARWLQRAVDRNYEPALPHLGAALLRTRPRDGVACFKSAVAAGDPLGKVYLARCLLRGEHLPRDPTLAGRLLREAAQSRRPEVAQLAKQALEQMRQVEHR